MADPPGTPPASPALDPPDLPPPIEEVTAAAAETPTKEELADEDMIEVTAEVVEETPTRRSTRAVAASASKSPASSATKKSPAAKKTPAKKTLASKKKASTAKSNKRETPKRKTRGSAKKPAAKSSSKKGKGKGGRKPSTDPGVPAAAALPGPFPLPPFGLPADLEASSLILDGTSAVDLPQRPGRPSLAASRLSPAVVSALAKAHAAVLEVFSIHLDDRDAVKDDDDDDDDEGEKPDDGEALEDLVSAARLSFPWLSVDSLRLHRLQRANWTGVADAARAAATAAAAEKAVASLDETREEAAQRAAIVALAGEAVERKREEAELHARCRARALGEPVPESAKKKRGRKKGSKNKIKKTKAVKGETTETPDTADKKRGRPRKLPTQGGADGEEEVDETRTPLKKRARREDDGDDNDHGSDDEVGEDDWKSDDNFDKWLAKFVEFKEKGIHIPTKSPKEMNLPSHPYYKLFKWTNRVRGQLLRIEEGGKRIRLTPERARAVLDAGIEDKRRGAHKTWDDRIEDLEKFKSEHGHCHVPHSVASLGMWCGHMRRLRRIQLGQGGGEGKGLSYGTDYLTPDRIAQLDGMGFVWDLKSSEHAPVTPRGPKSVTPTKLVEAEAEFAEMLEALLAYKEVKGDMRIPTRCAEMNESDHPYHRLYKWAKKVRRQKVTLDDGRATTLTPAHVAALEEVGFKFRLHTYVPWEERMESVRSFYDSHGHLSVPGDHPLARWCAHMRTLRRKMRAGESPKSLYHDRDYLTPEREEELTRMGFVWELRNEEEKRLLTPRKSEAPKKRGPTSEEKAELERLEFSEMLVHLRDYADVHGGPPGVARAEHFEKGAPYHKLWQFCNKQRRERTALVKGEETSTMTRERFEALEGAGMRFAPAMPAKTWEERMEMCRTFRREHGHLCPPVSNPEIGTWTVKMRQLHNAGTLALEKVRELDAMGFVWKMKGRRSGETKNKSWNQRFADLEAWKEEHGHIRVPKSVPTLNGWLDHQKNEFHKMMRGDESRITVEQAQRLKDIGVCIPPKKKTWAEHYEDLLRFKNRHGHISVPKTEPLHNWLHKEKKEFRRMVRGERTSMTVEKVEMLDSLGVFQHCRTKPDD